MGWLALATVLAGIPEPVEAQNNLPPPVTSPAPPASGTSSQALDTAKPAPAPVPLGGHPAGYSQNAQDSSLAGPAGNKSRSDTVLVVKHSFNHRQQIIAGSVIMTCLMLMMVTMNNYNPR